jgi:hypothetical protein
VAYVIDRRSNLDFHGYEVKSPEDEYESVDAIVVTAVIDFIEIYDLIRRKIQCPILSIQELLQEI